MRLVQFLAEYERELSKKRRPRASRFRSLKVTRSLPGQVKVEPRSRTMRTPLASSLRSNTESVPSPSFEEQLDTAIRKRKLKIQLEGIGNADGRGWEDKAVDRTGVKKVDDKHKKSPDKQSAVALREIQLTAQGNVQRLSTIIQLAKDIRVVESGIGSAGGHIARELGSPGPINGHNLVRPWERKHSGVVSNAQSDEILVHPSELFHPDWNHHHVAAKLLSLDVLPEKNVKDPLFAQEIQHFRQSGAAPQADYTAGLPSSIIRPASAPSSGSSSRFNQIEAKVRKVDSLIHSMATNNTEGPSIGAIDARVQWVEAIKYLRYTAQELSYKDLTELTALREPPEPLMNLIAYICILLGLHPTWQAAKRSLFKELHPLQNFLREVDPLTLPLRRLKRASLLKDQQLSFLDPKIMPQVSRSPVFEKLAKWVMAFDALAKTVIAVDHARTERGANSQSSNHHLSELQQEICGEMYAYPVIGTAINTSEYGIPHPEQPPSPTNVHLRAQLESNRKLAGELKVKEDAKIPSKIVAAARKKYRVVPKVIEQVVHTTKVSKFDQRPSTVGTLGKVKSKSSASLHAHEENAAKDMDDKIGRHNADVLHFFETLASSDVLRSPWSATSSTFSSMAQAAGQAARPVSASASSFSRGNVFSPALTTPKPTTLKTGASVGSATTPSVVKDSSSTLDVSTSNLRSAIKGTELGSTQENGVRKIRFFPDDSIEHNNSRDHDAAAAATSEVDRFSSTVKSSSAAPPARDEDEDNDYNDDFNEFDD